MVFNNYLNDYYLQWAIDITNQPFGHYNYNFQYDPNYNYAPQFGTQYTNTLLNNADYTIGVATSVANNIYNGLTPYGGYSYGGYGYGNYYSYEASNQELSTSSINSETTVSSTSEVNFLSTSSDDLIEGSDLDDYLFGEDGNDWLFAGDGDDFVSGDSISLAEDETIITDGNGNDLLVGGDGSDFLFAGDGDDFVIGGNVDVSADGNFNFAFDSSDLDIDVLVGGGGNDLVIGDNGNDILIGSDFTVYDSGSGESDYLIGGGGRDVFVLGDEYEAYYLGEGFATIMDFNTDNDIILTYGSTSDYSTYEDVISIGDEIQCGGVFVCYQGDEIGFLVHEVNEMM